jgi:hypothetical protein
MNKYFVAAVAGIGLVAVSIALFNSRSVAAQASHSSVVFDADGKMKLPTGYRRWVFVGAPVTPNALNNGEASFPEFHHVYVEAKNLDEGTVFVKELTRVLNPTFPDGSRTEPSGRGFFNGEFNGIDLTVKDSKRFAKTNGWGFFTFGHHPLPYDETAAEAPATQCAGCHVTFVSKTDMTWVQFYPMLREKHN